MKNYFKKVKGFMVAIVTLIIFAPTVYAETIELTQEDFTIAGNEEKGVVYSYEGNFPHLVMAEGSYKFTEDITLPDNIWNIEFSDGDYTIDASGYTFTGVMSFYDSNVNIIGGTFKLEQTHPGMYWPLFFVSSNVIIKDGIFNPGESETIFFDGGEYGDIDENGSYGVVSPLGKITIENGTFNGKVYLSAYEEAQINNGKFNNGILMKSKGTTTIKNGEFKKSDDGYSLYYADPVVDATLNNGRYSAVQYEGKLTIENGNFDGKVQLHGGKEITIKDATLKSDEETLLILGNETAKNVKIEKGSFNSTSIIEENGAIKVEGVDEQIDMDILLASNSQWSEDLVVKFYDRAPELGYTYTQKEIRVIEKEKEDTNGEIKDETKEETKEETKVESKEYKTIKGENQVYDINSAKDLLTFTFDIEYSEFVKSGKVYVDNFLIDSSCYEVKEGSTKIIFTKTYTDLLKAGSHTIKVVTDKGVAQTTFKIEKSETIKNPKTLDNIGLCFMVLVTSVGVVYFSKKKLNNN